MRKRKQQVTGKNLTVSRSNQRCSSEGENFDPIPVDIVINILSRSSVKFMARLRCVSKHWSSIIRRPYYNELFPIKCRDPPRCLFTFVGGGKLFFYTSPDQPQNPHHSYLVATRHHTSPLTNFYQISGPVHGLVCHQRTGGNYILVVISNPITGESLALPKVTANVVEARSYLGYDPIEKQFKVLCISWVLLGTDKTLSLEHQVLTLMLEDGSRNLLWRKIQCCSMPFHGVSDDAICIDGVLYYTTAVNEELIIVCFDVRSERFDFIGRMIPNSTLVNYKGKLGAVDNRDSKDLVLWVLEEHEWSKRVYIKPFQWRQVLNSVYAAGVSGRGEVVLCTKYAVQAPLNIYYFDLQRNIVVRVRVEVPGFEGFTWPRVCTFPNYVEHVKLM